MKNSFFSTNKSSHNVRCTYCGEWMAEEDVFCQNCWKITPKVQEMLTRFPNKKLDDYHPISKRKGYACPHCGSIFEKNLMKKFPA